MSDIQVLKRIYRMQARVRHAGDLAAQLVWLMDRFANVAAEVDEGSPEVTSVSYKGQASATQFRGSTAEERAQAVMQAIEEVEAEIAAAAAGEDPPAPVGALLPRVVCAPR